MALISKIRERGGLLIVLIALGLGGFILMDIMDSRKAGGLWNDQSTLGKINGHKIDYKEFSEMEKKLYSNQGDAYGNRFQAWNYFVENVLIKDEADAVGLGVGAEELNEVCFGTNISPIIQQKMANPQTGQLDPQTLAQIKQAKEANQLPAEFAGTWKLMEEQVIKDRLQTKLTNMAAKAIFTPTWMMEQQFEDNNQKVDFAYVRIPFDVVADSEVKLEDADYQAYIDEYKSSLKRPRETRALSYLALPVVATTGDSSKVKEEVAKMVAELKATTNDSVFIESNNGYFDRGFVKKSVLPIALADSLGKGAGAGSIIGPYKDNESYCVAKLKEVATLADSVKVRHILIGNKQKPDADAKKLADSLLTQIIAQKGANFGAFALQFSDDPGSKDKGGEYTFSNTMSLYPEFYDYCFKTGKVGEFKIVKTEMGGYHIMQVQGYKGGNSTVYKFGYIRKPVTPSDETQSKIEDIARNLLEQNRTLDALTKAIEKDGFKLEKTNSFEAGDYNLGSLGGDETTRDMIKWAFNPDVKVGDVCNELKSIQDKNLYYTSKFVIIGLKSIILPGVPTVANAKEEVQVQVRNRKKGDIIKSKIQSKDLMSIAGNFASRVDTAKEVSFAQSFIPNIGNEGGVMAKAFGTNVGSVADPVVGLNGVFVVQPINKPQVQNTMMNNPAMRSTFSMSARNQVKSKLIVSMKENADIKDNRSKFF